MVHVLEVCAIACVGAHVVELDARAAEERCLRVSLPLIDGGGARVARGEG